MVFTQIKKLKNSNFEKNLVLERAKEMVHLGTVITQDLAWNRNVTEIFKKAFPRVRMVTKLKIVGVKTKYLIEVYCLYIRNLT